MPPASLLKVFLADPDLLGLSLLGATLIILTFWYILDKLSKTNNDIKNINTILEKDYVTNKDLELKQAKCTKYDCQLKELQDHQDEKLELALKQVNQNMADIKAEIANVNTSVAMHMAEFNRQLINIAKELGKKD